jgi:hypothetical protein
LHPSQQAKGRKLEGGKWNVQAVLKVSTHSKLKKRSTQIPAPNSP